MIRNLISIFTEPGVRGAGVRSTFWTVSGFGMQSVLRLGSNLILVKLLAPEVFGLMSLAMVFITGITLMSELGTRNAIIRSTRDDPDFLMTAWTIQVIRGFVVASVTCLVAWPASQFYDQPQLFPVLCCLSIMSVVSGFYSISMATVSRNMKIARLTLMTLFTQVIAISVTVSTAWWLGSIWAMVLGTLTGAFLTLILSHLILPRIAHRLQIEPSAFTELINFGKWALPGAIFTFFGGQGITAVQGALVDITTLGILAISTLFARAFEDLVGKLLNSVGLPTLSITLRNNPERLPFVLTRLRNTLILACVAGFIALSLFARPLIELLYEPPFTAAGGFLALQALNGAMRVLSLPYLNVFLAQGDSRIHAIIMFCSAIGGVVGTVVGFQFFGVYGMLTGLGVAALVIFAMSTYIAWSRGFIRRPLGNLVIAGGLILIYVLKFQSVMAWTPA